MICAMCLASSVMSNSVTLCTVAHKAPPSMGFSRKGDLLQINLLGSSMFWCRPWNPLEVLQPLGSQRVGHDQATSLSPCLVLQKNSKIVLCESLEVEPGPCPKAILLFLDCPSLVSSSPSLTSNCLNLPFRTHRRSSEVAPIRYK